MLLLQRWVYSDKIVSGWAEFSDWISCVEKKLWSENPAKKVNNRSMLPLIDYNRESNKVFWFKGGFCKLPFLSAGDHNVTGGILLQIWATQNRHLMSRPDLLFLRDDQWKKCLQFKTLVLNIVRTSLYPISDPNSWSLHCGTSIFEVSLASWGVQTVKTTQRDVSRKRQRGGGVGGESERSLFSP